MARITIAALQAEIAALRTELSALRTAPCAPSAYRKNAATLYVDGHPRVTYFTHSEAYRVMKEAKARGHSALYKPCH